MALISFDLDGVLQQNPFQGRRPDGVFGRIRQALAPYLPDRVNPEDAAMDLVRAEHKARMQGPQLADAYDWDGIVATVAARLGARIHVDVGALVDECVTNRELCYLYPGVHECLQALTAAGHTLVTTTNGFSRYQIPVLRQLGVLSYFRAVISPDTAGWAKPEPGIFRAAEAYGQPRIHMGDILPHDVAGPKRAGWKAILVAQDGRPGGELPADVLAKAPHERPALAQEWLGERLAQDRRLYGNPPVADADCVPDAIVVSLAEAPAAVAALLG